jgi:AraC-like DNA-binding protein
VRWYRPAIATATTEHDMGMSALSEATRTDRPFEDTRPRPGDTVLRGLLEMASASLDRDGPSARDLLDRAMALLAERQVVAPDRPKSGCGLAAWSLNRVKRHVEENLGKRISLAQLAALSRLSPSHFSRAFKESAGITPHAYVLARRVARAQLAMIASDAPLSQIAINLGFADQAHFTRHFKRSVGAAPHAWRRDRRLAPGTAGGASDIALRT